nr:reverse transcriptase domain-containing protein [Tanacetum cinerariifolium]
MPLGIYTTQSCTWRVCHEGRPGLTREGTTVVCQRVSGLTCGMRTNCISAQFSCRLLAIVMSLSNCVCTCIPAGNAILETKRKCFFTEVFCTECPACVYCHCSEALAACWASNGPGLGEAHGPLCADHLRCEPGEMAPESSRAVVVLKFDMHIYTSKLTSTELKDAIDEYCIPVDLHPRLPHPGMAMNRLPSRFIASADGVNKVIFFEIRCVSLDISPTVSVSGLLQALQTGPLVSFENKTRRGTRKCFKEITSSLKGWKKKFFLLDRRTIPNAMPWRHSDTDLHDDFPTHFNEDDVARLFEFQGLLRSPPRHLLYMCGLTTACRHSGLQYHIKDQDKNVISMDTFLKLLTWIGTVVSKGDPLLEDQRPKPRVTPPLPVGAPIPALTPFHKNLEKPNPKIAAAMEKKDQQSLARAEAKRAAVMSSPDFTVMYTSISFEDVLFWGIRFFGMEQPDSPKAAPQSPIQTPPVPQDEDKQCEHVLSAEEQSLPPVVSPTAESPGYVAESDPEEDPEEYEDDDFGHFAVVVPTIEPVSPPEGTEPVIPPPSTDITTTGARITVQLQASISLPPEAEVERLLAMPTPPPSPLTSLSPPSAEERLARLSCSIKSQAGSESRPPMLNKENYVPWSSRLLRYAKSRPNGKLIHNSILNGPYVRKMIPEPGDANRDITVTETFHLQTDDKLSDKELKQIEADDQAIQTILLGLPEDIYAAVDSCETDQEIWLRVHQMMKGSDIRIQEKKAKLFNEWESHSGVDMLPLFIRPRICTQLITLNYTQNPLSQKLENKNVELEFQVLNYARENAHLKATYTNLFDSISVSRSRSLPSNNPKGKLKAITTRSGLVTDGSTVPTPPKSITPEVNEHVEETYTDPDLAEYTIKVPPPPQLHLNITLAEALVLMPKYQKMVKALLSNKEKLQEFANTPLNENCSAVILKKLPEKLGDPGKFLIPCGFSELKCKALPDLGASINLMPLSVWKELGLPELIPTHMTLELANRSICTLVGIAKDVFVPVGKFTFPADFVIVDYESDLRVLLILGRPFLRTARALIDVHEGCNDIHPPFDDSPLSGSTTYFSNLLLEEFTDDLALITYPPDYDDNLQFDIESDLKEIEFLLYQAGSESRPPMLNKEKYVPWSSCLLRYAKSRPNGKLIHKSILNGPYVRQMIPEPVTLTVMLT